MTYMPTYYEVLGIPAALQKEPHLPTQTVRTAYRRALLQNHPDKSKTPTVNSNGSVYSIDQITEAYSHLSDPKARAKYDDQLNIQRAVANDGGFECNPGLRTGIESVDLDDLEVDEAEGIWYRSCRCGDERGYLVKEEDLEEAAEEGEISVGCSGCSIWINVLFRVMENV